MSEQFKPRFYRGHRGMILDLTPTAASISMGINGGPAYSARCLLELAEFRQLLAEGEALIAAAEEIERRQFPPRIENEDEY